MPGSTALYPGSTRDIAPIAFSVTAPDRSLSMLWVDPGYRKRGLGSWVAEARLAGPYGMLKREWDDAHDQHGAEKEIPAFGKAKLLWSQADVDVKNTGSRRICEGLGGVSGWTVVWIRVETEV